MGGGIMKNTFIAPASIEEMLTELGDNENIIVLEGEKKLYVPVGAMDDSFDTTCARYIMLSTSHKDRGINITPTKAFELIKSSYLRTVE